MLQVPEPRGDVVFVAYLAFATVFFHFKKGPRQHLELPHSSVLSPFHPLAKFPGPLLSRITKFWLAYVVYTGKRHLEIAKLHDQYGTFVRTGPNTLSINSHEAIRTIYATSTSMDKSNAYRPGRFFGGGLFFIRRKDMHAERRRIWAPAFSPV
ncbi:Cytochrome P450 [Mycena venus]|uniref:Cytochrome P450 n=1 Tax=Mycena venus TaxID=2733690 RepID=A0A8H6X8Q3_9AGAR|nr:Cytochrome P450 [Mycena venus]